jgi:hypothetical protein
MVCDLLPGHIERTTLHLQQKFHTNFNANSLFSIPIANFSMTHKHTLPISATTDTTDPKVLHKLQHVQISLSHDEVQCITIGHIIKLFWEPNSHPCKCHKPKPDLIKICKKTWKINVEVNLDPKIRWPLIHSKLNQY